MTADDCYSGGIEKIQIRSILVGTTLCLYSSLTLLCMGSKAKCSLLITIYKMSN